MSITPADGPWLEVPGGWARRVIDLANEPETEITPLAPGLAQIRAPWQPVKLGHATDVNAPDAPVYTDGQLIRPEHAAYVDTECPDCDSALVVLPNLEPGVTWLVVEHRESCPWLARKVKGLAS